MMTTTKTNPEDAYNAICPDICELVIESKLSVLSIHQLRKDSPCDRETIDAGLLEGARLGEITLYEHDYPPGLSKELRASLLWSKGRAYNAFIIRQK